METSVEQIVKLTIKTIAKKQELDYAELKSDCKKITKMAKKVDEQLMGIIEELMDIGNVGSEEELGEFDIATLEMYCRIKELDFEELSEKKIRSLVWENMQEEFELSDSESESESESDSESEDELEPEIVIPEPVKEKKKKVKIVSSPTVIGGDLD